MRRPLNPCMSDPRRREGTRTRSLPRHPAYFHSLFKRSVLLFKIMASQACSHPAHLLPSLVALVAAALPKRVTTWSKTKIDASLDITTSGESSFANDGPLIFGCWFSCLPFFRYVRFTHTPLSFDPVSHIFAVECHNIVLPLEASES